MDASCYQLVLQRLVLSESVFRSLCHKQRINLVALHVLDQMLVRGPHLQAHEHAVHQLWLLRHEPHETQVERLVVAQLLCQPHAAFSHTIDISLSGVKAVERHIIDGLDQHADSPQQQHGKQRSKHYASTTNVSHAEVRNLQKKEMGYI